MKRILMALALLAALGATAATAQTRVSVSIGFGAPFVAYHPRSYHSHPYIAYHPRPAVVVVRPYRPARVVVIRQRHHPRRHHRRW